MPYLLDTNICVAAMPKRHLKLNQRIERAGQAITISSIVAAELWYGVGKSVHRLPNRVELERFLANLVVIDFDERAAEHYGDIRSALERDGTPIGNNDVLIAGHARSLGYTLITNNRREFDRVPGLKVENWLA